MNEYYFEALYEQGILVITTAEQAADFEETTGFSLAEVDLDTHQVVVLLVYENTTCGLVHGHSGVWQLDDQEAPHAELVVLDPTGTCDEVCDGVDDYVVVLVVEHSGTEPMTACTREEDSCDR